MRCLYCELEEDKCICKNKADKGLQKEALNLFLILDKDKEDLRKFLKQASDFYFDKDSVRTYYKVIHYAKKIIKLLGKEI